MSYLALAKRRWSVSISLHVAMQMGPYHHLIAQASGVWPLRILIVPVLGFRRFIVSTIPTISANPEAVRCCCDDIIATHTANFSKSSCFADRSGYSWKNGITTPVRWSRRRTAYR